VLHEHHVCRWVHWQATPCGNANDDGQIGIVVKDYHYALISVVAAFVVSPRWRSLMLPPKLLVLRLMTHYSHASEYSRVLGQILVCRLKDGAWSMALSADRREDCI